MRERHPLLSRPLKVYWAGWQSDTYSLQQQGWELSVDQDVRQLAMRVALQHQDMRCVAVSNLIQDFRYDAWAAPSGLIYAAGRMDPPAIYIQYFATRLEVVRMQDMRCTSFRPIDAAPQFIAESTVTSFDDLKWFAAPLVETRELIVDPDRVGDILAKIAEAQLPEQEAIRKRNALRASREGLHIDTHPRRAFHAQVISIAA